MKFISLAILLLLSFDGGAQPNRAAPGRPKFLGCEITVVEPEREDDFFPKGPASLCIEGPPAQQCYTMPSFDKFPFGNDVKVSVIEFGRDRPAIFFSAATGGVSGWSIHFSLLRPGKDGALENLLPNELSVSNQSQHAFWNDPTISATPIFVIAEDYWGQDEGHYGKHRYIVSAYVWAPSEYLDDPTYNLEDRFMTTRKFDLEKEDVLASEKQEILARLRRVKAQAGLQRRRVQKTSR